MDIHRPFYTFLHDRQTIDLVQQSNEQNDLVLSD